jgi:hypothetical protein
MCRIVRTGVRRGGLALVLSSLVASVSGCGGGSGSPAPTSQYNNYAGTQNVLTGQAPGIVEGGLWSLSLDDENKFFSYLDLGAYAATIDPTQPTIGNFAGESGFVDMTVDGGTPGSGGYAVEVPGSAAAFRPGNGATYPVVAVGSNSCQNPGANTTYQFVVLSHPLTSGGASAVYPAYGSIQATANGTAWSFANFSEYAVDGTSQNPTALPSGTCAYTQEGYVVSIPTNSKTKDIPITVGVGPTGFFMADLGQNGVNAGAFGLVGTVQPSSQVSTSDIVSGSYIGFQYVPLQGDLNVVSSPVSLGSVTSPVAFGQTAGSGTTITGGVYPDDDVTQTAPSNITIELGQQDSKNNGLFTAVTVTIPDPAGACVARPYGSKDANGNPTCVFPGVAVVGNPGGKYAVFVTADDKRSQTFGYGTDAALEYFLYQP